MQLAQYVVLVLGRPVALLHVLPKLLEDLAFVENLFASQLVDQRDDFSFALPHVAVVQTVHHQELSVSQNRVECCLQVAEVVQSYKHPPHSQTLSGLVAASGVKVNELNGVKGCALSFEVVPVVRHLVVVRIRSEVREVVLVLVLLFLQASVVV